MPEEAVHIISSGTVRCARLLSEDGTVVVFKGQMADPTTQIAFRKIWSRHFSLNILDALDLDPADNIREFLTIKEGDFVSVGEQIAKREGRRKLSVTAKASGRFLGISANRLIFESDPVDIESRVAGFPGVVTDIVNNRGAYLETSGSYIKGLWGNGKCGQGILLSIDMEKNNGIFDLDSISVDLAGAVVFANTCTDANVLKTAAKMTPGGLIFGSLPSYLLPVAVSLPFPIIVTDWIGTGKISNPVHLTLGENIIKFAYLYSDNNASGKLIRPEIIIPQDEYIPEKENPLNHLGIGSQVRIIEGFYGGELGIVVDILPGNDENSDNTEIAPDQVKICIDEETYVTLPKNNVEVINLKS